MRNILASCLACLLLASGCAQSELPSDVGAWSPTISSSHKPSAPMNLSSSAFDHEGKIPSLYTCDGENISPPLSISGVPAEAKSLALIVGDPDVPKSVREDGLWIHWVLANLSPTTTNIGAGANPASLGTPGKNTREAPTYGGPCPPDREHRYFFRLYALDTRLDFARAPTKDEVEKAMEGHIIAETSLMGRYERIK